MQTFIQRCAITVNYPSKMCFWGQNGADRQKSLGSFWFQRNCSIKNKTVERVICSYTWTATENKYHAFARLEALKKASGVATWDRSEVSLLPLADNWLPDLAGFGIRRFSNAYQLRFEAPGLELGCSRPMILAGRSSVSSHEPASQVCQSLMLLLGRRAPEFLSWLAALVKLYCSV